MNESRICLVDLFYISEKELCPSRASMGIPEVGPCPSRASVLCNVSCVTVSSVRAWLGSSKLSA
jgi:hypothetical protein